MTKSEVLARMGSGLRDVARAAIGLNGEFERLAVELRRTKRVLKRLAVAAEREADMPKSRRAYRRTMGRNLPGSRRTARLRKKLLAAHRHWLSDAPF